MEEKATTQENSLEKWGFPLDEIYKLAFNFYKQNTGKALHLSYEDNLKLIAFKQQASLGPFNANLMPELGVLDVIGKDRRIHWKMLGDLSKEKAQEGFIDLLNSLCNEFRPYIEAVKKSRDEQLKNELRRMEEEKLEREKREKEQKELLEEGYKEEIARRQLQDALNKQTYQQFKSYAEKQFPGNPEQQAVLIHQLQQEHYHQYMQQLHLHQNGGIVENNIENDALNQGHHEQGGDENANSPKQTPSHQHDEHEDPSQIEENSYNPSGNSGECEEEDDDYIIIKPAKIWTRPDIEEFKNDVSAGEGDGVITIGHGDTVTVRVPTNVNGKCIFWEFATDSYDIGFGVYFEWSKPITNEVTVHVSDSDDDDEYNDEDYLSTNEDLETGSVLNERPSNIDSNNASLKPPVTIIVPIYRRECFNEVYVGSHSYPGEGVYLLKFDNSYSIWRSKTLYYRVYYER